MVAILFIIVVICLTVFYAQNHANHVRQELSFTIANKSLKIEKAPHVILVVLDTVRADRLSIYRSPHITHRTSKNLEEFSGDALIFENCIATSSWTLPSHASLFTGLYPSEHGMHTKLDSKNKWFWGFPPLSEKLVTLAEIFKDNRYSTGAVVANNDVLHPGLKFNQGFSHYNCVRSVGSVYRFYPFHPIVHLFCHLTNIFPKYIFVYRTADDITKESFRMLDKLSSGPFFLFINYMDAHDPYQPPRPFDGYFLDTSFPQLYRLQKHFLYFTGNLNQKSWNSYLLSQYDGEIAYLDAQLGKLFARLKQKDMYDSSLIIITSDHGELFDENGFSSHKTPMYEGVIKVPLIIKFPFKRKVGREKTMITLADLYPTILSICDLPVPEGISGKTFGKGSLPIVSELYNYGIGEHRILYNGEYKYMRYQQQREPELYNLHKDPMEKVNMVNVLPEVTMKMEEELREWEMTHGLKFKYTPKKEGTFTKEIWEGLRALGYLQ
ncbi:MAG: sulfatase [Deltaproteobacteria bacterium]|nr:sulfatase [Deltaproteobacteria bacterium]